MPDLANTVDLLALLPDTFDLGPQNLVALGLIRQQISVRPLGHVIVERARGNRQVPADRLDPNIVAVFFNEGDHVLNRRSSSA